MAKLLTEKENILSNPDTVRAIALEQEYYTKGNHPQFTGEMVCHISEDVSKEFGILSDATNEVIFAFQELTNKTVTEYKTYLQYNTSTTEAPYVHTDQWLDFQHDPIDGPSPKSSMKVNYIGNVYLCPPEIEQDTTRFEFYTADDEESDWVMADYLKLADDKITSIGTKAFGYNKAIIFDSSIPHKNAPICDNYWGTTVADSPLCFTVFMNTD